MRTVGACLAILVVLLLPATVFAQASLTGTVRDASGAVLPGVTVEASSPALIEKTRTAVTDGTGQYRITDLRTGTYSLTFALPARSISDMKIQSQRVIAAMAAAMTLQLSLPIAAAGQAPGAARAAQAAPGWPPAGPTPRTAEGKPDLSGNWQPNAIRQNVDMIGAGVEVPMLPAAEAVYKKRKEAFGREDPEARCLPPGVPRMSTTPYPWSIIQTPKEIVIVYEGGAHIWRKIFMDGRPHDPKVEQTWLGDSTGHWEGDTLVVETVGQNDITWIDAAGIPHSTDMKVTERITRTDFGHMEIVHIIEDPKTFSRTWTFTTKPTLLRGELIEYICQENNRDVEHLVGK